MRSKHNRPNRLDSTDAADVIDALLIQRDELMAALVDLANEPQPLGIDRPAYQEANRVILKYLDGAAA